MAFAPRIQEELTQICGSKWVKDDEVALYTYCSDGLTLYTKLPMGIVYPANSRNWFELSKSCIVTTPGKKAGTFLEVLCLRRYCHHRNGSAQRNS